MPPGLLAADLVSNVGPALAKLVGLWPLWLPLVVGALAIFLLLPRPRPFPASAGALAGGLALLLGGGLLVRTAGLSPEVVLFYAFSGLTIVGATLLVTQHDPARAALSFTLVILSTCGLFLLLAAPFLMAATIIIYAGAIIVTFLFVLMLAHQAGLSSADIRSREPVLAVLTGFLLLAAILFVLQSYQKTSDMDQLLERVVQATKRPSRKEMLEIVGPKGADEEEIVPPKGTDEEEKGKNLFEESKALLEERGWKDLAESVRAAQDDWMLSNPLPGADRQPEQVLRDSTNALLRLRAALLAGRDRLTTARLPYPGTIDEIDRDGRRRRDPLPVSALSGTPAGTAPGDVRRNPDTLVPELPADNAAFLGRSLFTDYLLPVELGGTLLLIATVGAIAIARGRDPGRKS